MVVERTTGASTVAWYREKCLSCHTDAHHQPAGDCVSCHMFKRPAADVAHTAFTDHRIMRRRSKEDRRPAGVPGVLAPWRPTPPRFRNRNLGLAYVAAGEKHLNPALLQEGFRLLTGERVEDDAPALIAVGQVLLRKQRPREAVRLFMRALELEPVNALHHLNVAAALSAVPDPQAAMAAAERAIVLDPLLKEAYVLAAHLYRESSDNLKATRIMQRYRDLLTGGPARSPLRFGDTK